MSESDYLTVRVRSIVYQGAYINQYEVVDPDGNELPAFQAGDHIDLYFRDGRVRQYSLCNDPAERDRYVFTVLREEAGRGGSAAIFELVHVGRMLRISRPRSNFPLCREASRHVLIAGGIGITPLISMAYQLSADGADFELHYCTREPDRTAFLRELRNSSFNDRVHVYHDGGVPGQGLDVSTLLRTYSEGTHLYYCGPPGFMRAISEACSHWPQEFVHFELFKPPEGSPAVPDDVIGADMIDVGFRVRLARQGREFVIPSDKSIIEVLRENGVDVETSCEAGLCQTCKTRYLEGEPDHRDYVLTEDQQREFVLICCSRSRSPTLVLDL